LNPVTHLLASWAIANTGSVERRDLGLVTVAGILPDVDGLGIVVDWTTRSSGEASEFFARYHHVLGHNVGMALFVTILAFGFARKRRLTAMLALIAVHVHLVADVLGGRGVDGSAWPIPYLLPFSSKVLVAWEGAWAVNALPNFLITAALLGTTLYVAWFRGFSPLVLVSKRLDAELIAVLRARFGAP
jgi:hypothetical protein